MVKKNGMPVLAFCPHQLENKNKNIDNQEHRIDGRNREEGSREDQRHDCPESTSTPSIGSAGNLPSITDNAYINITLVSSDEGIWFACYLV
jgi:hypothetical protein